jgi:hypothetical protein
MGPKAWAQVAIGLTAAAATGLYLSSVFEKAHQEAAKTAGAIGEIKRNADELAGSATTAKSAVEKLTDLQKRMQELQRVKSHSPQLAKALAGKELNAADMGKVLELDAIGSAAESASPRVTLLREALVSLNSMDGLIPAQQISDMQDRINAAIVREIDDRSGVTKAIAKQADELKRLQLGEEAYQAAKMAEAGASGTALAKLAALQTQTDATKALQDAAEDLATVQAGGAQQLKLNQLAAAGADQATLEKIAAAQQLAQAIRDQQTAEEQLAARAKQIQESTLTDQEKQLRQIAEINELRAKGLIDEETAKRALANIGNKDAKVGDIGRGQGTNNAAMAGTSDAISIMLKGAFGSPNEQAQKTRQQILAEMKELVASNKVAKKDAARPKHKSVINI